MTRLRRAGGRLFSIALIIGAAGFLFATLRDNWRELETYEWSVDAVRLLLSTVALATVLAWGVWVWSRVLRRFDAPPVETSALQRVWFLSNLARYIPGKIWQFVGVAQLARAGGISAAVLVTSMVVHVGFTILAAAAVSAVLYPYEPMGLEEIRWLAPAAVGIGVLAGAHPAVLNLGLGLARRLTRRDVLRWTGSWSDGLVLVGYAVVAWLLYGAAFHLFVSAIVPVGPNGYPAFVAVNSLSFLVGYVSPLPAGLGLREVAMTLLLRPFVPEGLSPALAILSRLWLIGAELLGAAVVLAFIRRRRTEPDQA